MHSIYVLIDFIKGVGLKVILCRDCNQSNKFYQTYPSWLGWLKAWGQLIYQILWWYKIGLSVPLVLLLPTKFNNEKMWWMKWQPRAFIGLQECKGESLYVCSLTSRSSLSYHSSRDMLLEWQNTIARASPPQSLPGARGPLLGCKWIGAPLPFRPAQKRLLWFLQNSLRK